MFRFDSDGLLFYGHVFSLFLFVFACLFFRFHCFAPIDRLSLSYLFIWHKFLLANSHICLVSDEEANNLVARIDENGSLDISFEEWRDYLLFHPSSNMDEIIKYWRRESHLNQGVDHGEDVGTPGESGFRFPCPNFSPL